MSNSSQLYGLQQARPPCPSSTPGVYSNSGPLSWWCHPATSSSVVPFSSCLSNESLLQRSKYWSFSFSISLSNEYSALISFRMDWLDLFRYDLNQIPHDSTVEVTNRVKGLDMIDRVPEELRMEVSDTVQEAGIKTIPKKKKCKKVKWLTEEAFQIAVKTREAKGKGEK